MCLDAQAPAASHHRNRIVGAAIECRCFVGIAREFRDSAERADTPAGFDVRQLLSEKIQKGWRARHRTPPPFIDGAELGAAVVATASDDAKLDGTPPTCTVKPP